MGLGSGRLKGRFYLAAIDAYTAALRARAKPRPGVTIVTVSFNAREILPTTLDAIGRFAPDAGVLVVDNDSRDGTRAWLRDHGIPHIGLHNNVWHDRALDLGFLRAGTEHVIALDVDAFPISTRFLDALLGPLAEGATVVGASVPPENAHYGRRYVHPCCLAMRLDRFVERRHSFASSATSDVGEMITLSEDRPHFIEPTSVRGPGMLGTVFGDIVYHNFYGTRFSNNDRAMIDAVPRDEPMRAWREAVDRYLGSTSDADAS